MPGGHDAVPTANGPQDGGQGGSGGNGNHQFQPPQININRLPGNSGSGPGGGGGGKLFLNYTNLSYVRGGG